jgi:glycosyltransferase involved in cell wall biosynthesis
MLKTFPIERGSLLSEGFRMKIRRQVQTLVEGIVRKDSVGLVHMHGVDFKEYLPEAAVPVLATLHLPPQWYRPEIFQMPRPSTYLNCVSRTEHGNCPPAPHLLPPIENGIPVAQFADPAAKRSFALALGRIAPEKGFHLALDAAWEAGVELLLAGRVFRYQAHEDYFRDEIEPRLDPLRRFIGPVTAAQKRRLLAAARCLLVPSLAPETSSLVAMEALASGTPVIAFRAGALVEIVEHGKTGFLVENAGEMARAIAAVEEIDPEICRETARRRFSLDRMTERYLEYYERIVRSTNRADHASCSSFSTSTAL